MALICLNMAFRVGKEALHCPQTQGEEDEVVVVVVVDLPFLALRRGFLPFG